MKKLLSVASFLVSSVIRWCRHPSLSRNDVRNPITSCHWRQFQNASFNLLCFNSPLVIRSPVTDVKTRCKQDLRELHFQKKLYFHREAWWVRRVAFLLHGSGLNLRLCYRQCASFLWFCLIFKIKRLGSTGYSTLHPGVNEMFLHVSLRWFVFHFGCITDSCMMFPGCTNTLAGIK